MKDAREFKQGNFAAVDGGTYEILKIKDGKALFGDEWLPLEAVSAIPLLDSWCMALGFSRKKPLPKWLHSIKAKFDKRLQFMTVLEHKGPFKLYYDEISMEPAFGENWEVLDEGEPNVEVWMGRKYIGNISSVHELQNIFKEYTGKFPVFTPLKRKRVVPMDGQAEAFVAL